MISPFAERSRALFAQAIAVAPGARARFLDEHCLDAPLRVELERLLGAYAALGDFLEPPAGASSDVEPSVLGSYELTRKLGEGGMGRVFLGEPGPVAVKLIRRDVDPEMVLRRFGRERDILGRLVHPNIARLIDGGDADGTPYLVMEYVAGTPLDLYCQARALGLTDRLTLFRGICSAVAYAHTRLVVHRDLKPANVLVTAGARPVVLDFGLAKLLDASPDVLLDSTRTGHRLLTPQYASPEQVRGLRATAATDVYALGVMLYELLTGVSPHRFHSWSLAEIVDVVCHQVPLPPSVAAPGDDMTRLRAGLDAVVMRAIAKTPDERFPHVLALDEAIKRHLA